ncbi:MAG TPA: membrane or secreted protein [Salinimicrobium sp.]|nr:membrane or secreted protein [Salinimicrobium sp.]
MKLLLITIILLALAFAGIAIKIWAKKDGKFAGTCASQSPFLNKEGESCSFCGKSPEEAKNCSNPPVKE